MVICKTEALVLKWQELGETSKIVTLYSKSFGKIKVVAKGARKTKSRFGASLEPITHNHIVFYKKETTDLFPLSQSDIIQPFPKLKLDLEQFGHASAVCELTDRLMVAPEPNLQWFRAILTCLEKIEQRPPEDVEKILWHFQLKACDILGYRPQLSSCVSCSKKLEGINCSLSFSRGGALCESCAGKDPEALTAHLGTIKFLGTLQASSLDKALILRYDSIIQAEASFFLKRFFEYHTENQRGLKSLEFLEKMKTTVGG